jgi:hypothetical protein
MSADCPAMSAPSILTAVLAQKVALNPFLHEFKHPFNPVNVLVLAAVIPVGAVA